MWRGRSESYGDNIQQNLYDSIFLEADNIQQIYHNQGYSYYYSEEKMGQTLSDEAIARTLQDIENGVLKIPFLSEDNKERSTFSGEVGRVEDDGDVAVPDPVNDGYEQISELGESIIGGLSAEQISVLPTHKYKTRKPNDDDSQCVICQMLYKKGDVLITLPCAHKYHKKCITIWLAENKNCCVCKKEVAVAV